ncbi:capsular polysaccharide synthesis protein [Bacillus carboniphilus]|uniref:Capsular polysaccharide synthesis protein n=1 Tax=Bacillus carboniphilus TaxID=86663 RepID=A0ABY9JTQ3_9BACI|nr:glycosyltransferase [Bacillus carboniphilus]WLR42787.1 capsular polysaccharide synthesis protein [Bacillus carboniphilus]
MDIMNKKIPKIIHYCWFGRKEKPPLIRHCMQTWKQHLPDYVFMEWTEETFDVGCNQYVREAYKVGKYAFVSDYVRVHALYHHGGIYLDTDVEIFKSFDDLLVEESIWGFEQENFIATSTIGAKKGHHFIKQFLDFYEGEQFIKEHQTFNEVTNVKTVTSMLEQQGLVRDGHYQKISNIGTFYPQTYFSPYDYINCQSLRTDETYAMHHFYKSWLPFHVRVKARIKRTISTLIGGDNLAKIRELVSAKNK